MCHLPINTIEKQSWSKPFSKIQISYHFIFDIYANANRKKKGRERQGKKKWIEYVKVKNKGKSIKS